MADACTFTNANSNNDAEDAGNWSPHPPDIRNGDSIAAILAPINNWSSPDNVISSVTVLAVQGNYFAPDNSGVLSFDSYGPSNGIQGGLPADHVLQGAGGALVYTSPVQSNVIIGAGIYGLSINPETPNYTAVAEADVRSGTLFGPGMSLEGSLESGGGSPFIKPGIR